MKIQRILVSGLLVVFGSFTMASSAFANLDNVSSGGAHSLLPNAELDFTINSRANFTNSTAGQLGQNPFATSLGQGVGLACKHVECHRLPPEDLAKAK